MGFTGLARWVNSPTHGLDLIRQNILLNHNGHFRGRWRLSVKSWRSTLGEIPGLDLPSERTMSTLTMNDNVFVLLEDPLAPMRADIVAAEEEGNLPPSLQNPSHYRTTFLTLSPPGALEQLITQLKARWTSIRQSAGAAGVNTGPQLTIDGHVYGIGADWVVRVGNVILAGGALKGMLLEAEYLPIPSLHSPETEGTSEMLSNLLTSVLPNMPDARTVAVTISDAQWEDVLWNREEEETRKSAEAATKPDISGGEDDIYVYGDEEDKTDRPGDWAGIDRDRRSAFLIMGALKSEGIL